MKTTGLPLTGVIHDYRPGDEQNEGKGVLIEFDHGKAFGFCRASAWIVRSAKKQMHEGTKAEGRRHNTGKYPFGNGQEQYLDVFSPDRPLRDMGFASLDLMRLRGVLSQDLGEQLASDFFFRYPTQESIIGYFEGKARSCPPSVQSDAGQPVQRPRAQFPEDNIESAPDIRTVRESTIPSKETPLENRLGDPVAIIGISCRFPNGANGTDKYWSLLRDGIDAITKVPKTRWDMERINALDPAGGLQNTGFGGFLDQVDMFDAQFFRIAPIEANYTDPQQRILLETAWEGLENAGINPDDLKDTQTGIFVGISTHDYEILQIKQNGGKGALGPYFATGNSASVAAGRLSYFFGCQGPAISVDTACSSSLVAVHLACRSLDQGECDLALAGGVNLILSPEVSMTYSRAGMLSQAGAL